MPSLSTRIQAFASFALEIGILYTVLFFVRSQDGFPAVASYLAVAMVPLLAFYAHRMEKTFRVPFFVWAIGLGYLFQETLVPLTGQPALLAWVAVLLGILIIFSGGLEVRFAYFKKLLLPILSLSVIGALATAFLFSAGLAGLQRLLDLPISIGTIGLLGAMLLATDPAAILPVLKRLKFKNPNDETIAISESAVNDVLSTIMTTVFAGLLFSASDVIPTLGGLYANLFSLEVGFDFLKELIVGVLIGYLSYHLLDLWRKYGNVDIASFPFLIGIAVTAYVFSTIWGGSGYLAVFIAGLLFELSQSGHRVERFFIDLTDGFVKPSVFVLLGALITPSFWTYAGLGILASLFFILIVRPIAVLLSLIWFSGRGKSFSFGDLFFLDAVRETGVIPAVLLVMFLPRLPDGEIAFAIGSWVIISTLVFLPLITEWWADRLNVLSHEGKR